MLPTNPHSMFACSCVRSLTFPLGSLFTANIRSKFFRAAMVVPLSFDVEVSISDLIFDSSMLSHAVERLYTSGTRWYHYAPQKLPLNMTCTWTQWDICVLRLRAIIAAMHIVHSLRPWRTTIYIYIYLLYWFAPFCPLSRSQCRRHPSRCH